MMPTIKDTYQLWWDFLKLSDRYKDYCANPPPLLKLEKLGFKYIVPHDNEASIKENILPGSITEVYLTFGNVHTDSFESFWKKRGKHLKKRKIGDGEPIENLKNRFELWFDMYKKICKIGCMPNGLESLFGNINHKTESLDSFKSFVMHQLNDRKLSFLCVDLRYPIEEIKKSFGSIVNKKAQKEFVGIIISNENWVRCRNRTPTPNLRFEDVERYLKVLRAYKIDGLRGSSAFKKVNPEKDYYEAPKEAFHSDKRKAERILKNVEIGYFPGIYENVEIKTPNGKFRSLDDIPTKQKRGE